MVAFSGNRGGGHGHRGGFYGHCCIAPSESQHAFHRPSVWGCHYILDWNYDEDRSRIRTGHGPENITRLRRVAIGIIKSNKAVRSVAQKMRQLTRNVRMVFDYLRMTANSCAATSKN